MEQRYKLTKLTERIVTNTELVGMSTPADGYVEQPNSWLGLAHTLLQAEFDIWGLQLQSRLAELKCMDGGILVIPDNSCREHKGKILKPIRIGNGPYNMFTTDSNTSSLLKLIKALFKDLNITPKEVEFTCKGDSEKKKVINLTSKSKVTKLPLLKAIELDLDKHTFNKGYMVSTRSTTHKTYNEFAAALLNFLCMECKKVGAETLLELTTESISITPTAISDSSIKIGRTNLYYTGVKSCNETNKFLFKACKQYDLNPLFIEVAFKST